MSESERSRSWLACRSLRVIASDDISTFFIFQSFDIRQVLRAPCLPLHLDQAFTGDDIEGMALKFNRFPRFPYVFDMRRNKQQVQRYHILVYYF